MGRGHIEQRQGSIPLNTHEQVVEVVGDTAGQGADGLHLVRMLQPLFEKPLLLLGLFAVGDVHGRESDAFFKVIGIEGG